MNASVTSKKNKAILYQSLYLLNLLLLPGLAFLYLLYLFAQNKHVMNWQRVHLYRAIQLSIVAGLLLVLIPLVVIYGSGAVQTSLMVIIVYFVTIHALLILIGMLNIARAMASKLPIF